MFKILSEVIKGGPLRGAIEVINEHSREMDSGRLSESGLTAAFAKPVAQTIALLGTSITDQNSVRQNSGSDFQWIYQGMGYWTQAAIRLRQRFSVVLSSSQGEFGGPGKTMQQMIDTGDIQAVIAANPAWCVFEGGTNDLFGTSPTPVDAKTAFSRAQTIILTLTKAGIRVIATTVMARAGTNGETANMYTQQRRYNEMLRRWVPTVPGAILCDWAPVMFDPVTGRGLTTVYYDGIHPNAHGASRMGEALATVLQDLTTTSDQLAFANGILGGQAFSNGTGGVMTGSNPSGGSGVLMANSTCYVDTGSTLVASKVPRLDAMPGEWQQINLSAVAGPTSGYMLQLGVSLASAGVVAGDSIYGVIEFETDSTAWDVKVLSLTMAQGSTNQQSSWGQGSSNSAHLPVALRRPSSGVLRTPPVVVNGTDLRLQARQFGVGTIRWGRAQIYKL